MSGSRSPQEKKALSYRHERRVWSGGTQTGLRVGRPRRKAGINRANRRIARQELAQIEVADDDWVISERPPWERWSRPVPLGQWVAFRLGRRREHAGWNMLKQPYDSASHRERFVSFLTAMTATSGHEAREIAAVWRARLDDRHPWLEAFFAEEPEWRERLTCWMARQDSEEPTS